MDKSNQILSDLVVFNKYAKYVAGEERRETWEEIVDRYINMMKKRYHELKEEIDANSKFLYGKKGQREKGEQHSFREQP